MPRDRQRMFLTRARLPPDRARVGDWSSRAIAILGLELGLAGGLLLATIAPASPPPAGIALILLAPLLLALPPRRSGKTKAAQRPTGLAGFPTGPATMLPGTDPDRPMAVVLLELDGFAAVRDTLGAEDGDALLQQASARLTSTARADDLVAHLGGPRFAVLQRAGFQPEAAAGFAGRLVRELSHPYALRDRLLICGAVAGIAVAAPGEEMEALLHKAGLALQRALAEGPGTARFFEPGQDQALAARHALEGALRQAAAAGEFALAYQPVFDARSRTLLGFEALLRWRHPERGPIPPAEFVPLLEETGLILPVGAWVLRTACAEALRWPEQIGVAVNLSPVQFRRGQVLGAVRAALDETGLAPRRLTLEITEGLLLDHTEAVLQMLAQLRDLGVTIALDDFGTGYSSLAYLWRFRFDTLKIDRAFVQEARRDGKAAAIVESIIGLGHSLDLRITAEGVETEEQLATLSGIGCDGVQGFLLGPPMPAEQAAALARGQDAAPDGAA